MTGLSEPAVAYIDSSAMVAVVFGEPAGPFVEHRLAGYSRWIASNLLEAELRAAYARERREFDADVVRNIEWITPDGPLTVDIVSVLSVGYLKGADLWHIATALYATRLLRTDMAFMTLDRAQQRVAKELGFVV